MEYIPNFIARKHGQEPVTYEIAADPVQETVTPHIVGFDPADQTVPENIDSHAYAEAIQRKDTIGGHHFFQGLD